MIVRKGKRKIRIPENEQVEDVKKKEVVDVVKKKSVKKDKGVK